MKIEILADDESGHRVLSIANEGDNGNYVTLGVGGLYYDVNVKELLAAAQAFHSLAVMDEEHEKRIDGI